MQLFILTSHCTGKAHCVTCRNKDGGHKWREDLTKTFKLPDNNIDFECPHGVPWGFQWATVQSTPQPSQIKKTTPAPQVKTGDTKVRDAGTRGGCGCKG